MRVDSGVRDGSVVPLDYDPIVAKLVVWGEDRRTALARLRRALTEYRIAGIATTLPLFRLLLDVEEFRTGALHTGLLDELLARDSVEQLEAASDPALEEIAIVGAACLAALDAARLPTDALAPASGPGRGGARTAAVSRTGDTPDEVLGHAGRAARRRRGAPAR